MQKELNKMEYQSFKKKKIKYLTSIYILPLEFCKLVGDSRMCWQKCASIITCGKKSDSYPYIDQSLARLATLKGSIFLLKKFILNLSWKESKIHFHF